MDYAQIIELVVRCIILTYAVATTLIMIISKIRKSKSAGKPIDIVETFKEGLELCNKTIDQMETSFGTIARDGAKTGVLKKNAVMTTVQQFLTNKPLGFDNDFWSDYIDKVIKIKNNDTIQTSENTDVSVVTTKGV